MASDVLPTWTGGSPPVFAWGYDGAPGDHKWRPELRLVPRGDMPAAWHLGGDGLAFVYALRCAHESLRRREYAALYGPAAMRPGGLPCRSLYCQW